MRDVAPGKPARLPFKATIPGRFEVELEDRGVQIADITVTRRDAARPRDRRRPRPPDPRGLLLRRRGRRPRRLVRPPLLSSGAGRCSRRTRTAGRSRTRSRPSCSRAPSAILLGAFSVGLLVLTLATALFGTTVELLNFAPTFVYVIFWLGIPLLSILFGNVWSVLSPWRAIADAAVWLLELGGREARPVLEWTGRMGRYPAAVALFSFVALELAHPRPAYPRTLGIAVALYTYWALAGMAVYGRDAWTRFGEGFAVAFSLLARIAPFAVRDGSVVVRWPFTGLAGAERIAGTLFFVAVLLGSTSFDGFSRSSTWQDLVAELRVELAGSSQRTVDLATTFLNLGGLAFFVAAILATYLAAVAAAERLGRHRSLARPGLRAPARPDRRRLSDRALLHALPDPGAVHRHADLRPVREGAGTSSGRPTSRRTSRSSRRRRPGTCRSRRSSSGMSPASRSRTIGRWRVPGATDRARGAAPDARADGPLHARRDVAAYAWLVGTEASPARSSRRRSRSRSSACSCGRGTVSDDGATNPA